MLPQVTPGPAFLECRTEHTATAVLLHVRGEVDLASVHVLDAALESALKMDQPVVVNLTEVSYIDSTGLLALVRCRERARRDGQRMALVVHSPTVRKLVEILQLDRIIPVFPSVDAALNG